MANVLRGFAMLSLLLKLAAGVALVAVITTLDIITGAQLSFSIFYFLPIVLVSWYVGWRAGLGFSILCALMWGLAEYYDEQVYSANYFYLTNAAVRLGIFVTVAWLIAKLRESTVELTRQQLIAQRSGDIITTTQRLIGLIAKNITAYNNELWMWQAEQRKHGRRIPPPIELASRKISTNLAALSEVSFGYRSSSEPVELEGFLAAVEEKVEELSQQGGEQE